MDRFLRAGVAMAAACGGLAACQSIIGADFGNYRVGGSDASGGDAGEGITGGRGGGTNGGSAGSGVTGGTGAQAGAGGASTGGAGPSGGTATGGAGAGGEPTGGSAGESGGPVRVVEVTGGRLHTCALLEGGDLKCWGYAFNGETGLDKTSDTGDMVDEMGDFLPPVNVGGGRAVQRVTAGDNHTCVLLDDGHVRCWGRNHAGQLGLGDIEERGNDEGEMAALIDVNLGAGRTATALDAGLFQTCAVLDDGAVKCWGRNTEGSLGLGSTDDAIGDDPGETVDVLPTVDLAGQRAVRISVGFNAACVLFDDETVQCWGDNTRGQLGIGGPSRGASSTDMGTNLPTLELGEGVLDVAIADGFACALLRSGSVKCWGDNASGALGLGSVESTTIPTESVQLGTGRTAVALSLGQTYACAMLDTSEVKCWGSSTAGGLGGRTSAGHSPSTIGDALASVDLGDDDTVVAIGNGNAHTCAMLPETRALKCWGFNDSGQLGLGDSRDRGAMARDMGNALPTVDLGTRP
jgi:alpha-tubulin suppressor-like RCC1 family protein